MVCLVMKSQTKSLINDLKLNNTKKNLSVKNHYWKERNICKNIYTDKNNTFSNSKIIFKILSNRGITSENYNDFIEPKIKNILPDPSVLDEMNKATNKIVDLIIKKKKIGILGDYDVDGTTSIALLCNYLKEIKIEYEYYIPDRINEGYGPNLKGLRELKEKKCELILTLDCGTTSNNVFKDFKSDMIDVIVVDHHQQSDSLPDVLAVINPNKKIDNSNLKNLSAVGVTFLLVVSINRELKKIKYFQNKSPDLIKYLDLVSLGTICDLVKLDDLNRAFVKQGLRVINNFSNKGINSLITESMINEKISEYHLGFVLGPRINAGGRVGNPALGVELLISENKNVNNSISNKLSEYNNLRKTIEKRVQIQAEKEALSSQEGIICVSSKDWHPGVIGIVASRLVEKFNRPSIVISENEDNTCKASCRSIGDFDIGNLIKNALNENIILGGGGHKMAGGFSILSSEIDRFKNFLIGKYFSSKNEIVKYYDCEISLSAISRVLIEEIQSLSPFGINNPKPKFLVKDSIVKFVKMVGNNHLSCRVEDLFGNSINAIAFKSYIGEVGRALRSSGEFDLIVSLNINKWNGLESVQVTIEDILKN